MLGPPAVCALLLSTANLVHSQQVTSSFPLRVESVEVVGEDVSLGSALAGRVGPEGNVYVIDHVNAQVVAFSPESRLLWKRGRKGQAPGEFQLPYRLDVRPDGTILVYDLAASEITTMSPDGAFVARVPLPFRFHQLDNLISTSNNEFVVAGVVNSNATDSGHAVHRFAFLDGRIDYRGSFGPLPAARDSFVLRYWGAGSIARTSDANVLFARRLPYEIHQYDSTGRDIRVIRPPFVLNSVPDDFMQVKRTGGDISVSQTEVTSELPGSLTVVDNGWVLVSRVSRGPDFWDLYSPAGRYAGTRSIPEEWGGFLGYDAARKVVWMTGVQGGKPVLFRIRVLGGSGN